MNKTDSNTKDKKKFKTGLFLGKFAPLHKGHQFVIETALDEVEKLIVLVYDAPSVTTIPLSVRGGWITKIYPQVEVIYGYHSPEDVGYTDEIIEKQNQYILSVLDGKTIDAFYSSEPYGDHVSKVLGAVNRTIDMDRKTIPISATKIRSDIQKYREYLSDVVYADHIISVLFIGGPSTGKTTIAKHIAEKLGTTWMPEYGREYWDTHQKNHRLSKRQLLELAKGHLKREAQQKVLAKTYLFTDTAPLTTYLFGKWYHKETLPKLKKLAIETLKDYDLIIMCDNDIPYDHTWDRSGELQQNTFQRQYEDILFVEKRPYQVISGSIKERTRQIEAILGKNQEKWKKYVN